MSEGKQTRRVTKAKPGSKPILSPVSPTVIKALPVIQPKPSIPLRRGTEARASKSVFGRVESSRIVVSETVYHQIPNEQPTVTQTKFTRWTGDKEQVYVRRTEVTPVWHKVDTGWVDKPGMLIISNDEDRISNPPNEEQAAELNTKVIEIHYHVPGDGVVNKEALAHVVIRPGEANRIELADGVTVYLRSREKESVRITVTAISR